MPSVSRAQQRLFQMARAAQKGDMKNPSPKVRELAKRVTPKQADDFARGSEKGKPEHVKPKAADPFPGKTVGERFRGPKAPKRRSR